MPTTAYVFSTTTSGNLANTTISFSGTATVSDSGTTNDNYIGAYDTGTWASNYDTVARYTLTSAADPALDQTYTVYRYGYPSPTGTSYVPLIGYTVNSVTTGDGQTYTAQQVIDWANTSGQFDNPDNIDFGSSLSIIMVSGTSDTGEQTAFWETGYADTTSLGYTDDLIMAFAQAHGGLASMSLGDMGGLVAGTALSNYDTTYPAPLCFAAGTLIVTKKGAMPVEKLSVGDRVLTQDAGFQPIRWIGGRKLSQADFLMRPKLRPVRIPAGALGSDLPLRDLVVSPQHRILMRSAIAKRMFNTNEVLVPAKDLVGRFGIDVMHEATSVQYWHIMLDEHQVVFAEGLPTETLYTGPEAMRSLTDEARQEIFAIFPSLETAEPEYRPVPARPLVAGKRVRALVERAHKNGQHLTRLV